MSRTTEKGPSGNQPDDGQCVVCGDDADGVDAGRDGTPPVCGYCAKIRCDGGLVGESQPIDPLVCPRGHHSIKLSAHRFRCQTCRRNGLEPARWEKSELVDLRTEEPPLADDGDERGRLVADGGDPGFFERVGEMVDQIEEEHGWTTEAEAMLYARCAAAFEDAYNNTDLQPENALGVMTAALFEAADRSGIRRSDVIESARDHYVDDADDVDRGDGPITDGGVTVYECDACGEVDRCIVNDVGQRRCPDCGCAVTAIVTDGGRDLYTCDTPTCDGEKEVVTPDGYVCQECADALALEYEEVDRNDIAVTDGGGRYHVVCSDCTFENLKRERHQAARAVDGHRTDEPSHDVRFEEVSGR